MNFSLAEIKTATEEQHHKDDDKQNVEQSKIENRDYLHGGKYAKQIKQPFQNFYLVLICQFLHSH